MEIALGFDSAVCNVFYFFILEIAAVQVVCNNRLTYHDPVSSLIGVKGLRRVGSPVPVVAIFTANAFWPSIVN